MVTRYLLALIFVFVLTPYDFLIPPQSSDLQASEETQVPEITVENLVFGPEEFLESNASGITLRADGMTIASNLPGGTYISQPFKAPQAFNIVVPQWLVDEPENDGLQLKLRTGNDRSNLGEWIEIHASMDWTLPDDEDVVGEMLVVPSLDTRHEYLQFRISLNRADTQNPPLLRELKLTLIDSTSGPSIEEMIQKQEEINRQEALSRNSATAEAASYPKPNVISREVWCIHPDCDYSEGLEYHPVTHLILHHTVSPNDQNIDSAAAVRGIWWFHTYERDWGDIGYNFLVDSKGVLFEGHLGGDDVVGIHAREANTGSMGLGMIGTFTQVKPPDPMVESIINLFSWKADQKDIDVFDASDSLPYVDYGLPHLMGHRDVGIITECPGNAAHSLIPYLRDEIASRIGLESPHIYVDELTPFFQKSDANWNVAKYQCGFNSHSWFTWSTTSPEASSNWGEWRPEIPESGKYQIEAYAPYCITGEPETQGAHYKVKHVDGTTDVIINQDDRVGLWTSLGEFNLQVGQETIVSLSDLTETDSGRGVWFDAIRLLPLEVKPMATIEFPADGSWLNKRTVNFTWQIENPEIVKAVVLQVATDSEFENRIVNEIWTTPTYGDSVDFNQDYAALYWRVVLTSESNNEYPSDVNLFGIDTQPPVSTVTKLYWFERTGIYQVFWQGEDALVGVENYNIDYRLAGEETWERWLSDTTAANAFFSPPNPDSVYEFRSQASDKLGNVEAAHPTADITTENAYAFTHAILLPLVSSQ